MATESRLLPIHPGEILREEFLKPLGMTSHELAMALRVPATTVADMMQAYAGDAVDAARASFKVELDYSSARLA